MFYKTGIDITNDKQMFNFIKDHFTYYTMNCWNGLSTIANNVKLYNLNLEGDWSTALNLLENGGYEYIEELINIWEAEHPTYGVYFNGRSGGYLVLSNKDNARTILPEAIEESDTYEEYKEYCQYYYGSVKRNRPDLVFYTKLIRDFDKLCDELRSICNDMSKTNFVEYEMQRSVEVFNERYSDDLEMLDFDYLTCDCDGVVDLHEVLRLQCLTEAFLKIANREVNGYVLKFDGTKIKLVEMY
jgi:hypothetical protein